MPVHVIPCLLALLPVAHVTGRDFRPADRKPVEAVIYWNRWKQR